MTSGAKSQGPYAGQSQGEARQRAAEQTPAQGLVFLGRSWTLLTQIGPRVGVLFYVGWQNKVFTSILPLWLASPVAQMVKRLPAMQETRVWSLGREDVLEKEMATHSSTLAWKIPWMEKPGRLQSMGLQRVGHDWATALHFTSSAYLRVLIFLSAVLIPACDTSRLAFPWGTLHRS